MPPSSTRSCDLVTRATCGPSRNAASTLAIVLRSWICVHDFCVPLDVAGVLWTGLSAPSSSGPVGVCSVVCLAPLHPHQLFLSGLFSKLPLLLHSAPSVALVPIFASPSGVALRAHVHARVLAHSPPSTLACGACTCPGPQSYHPHLLAVSACIACGSQGILCSRPLRKASGRYGRRRAEGLYLSFLRPIHAALAGVSPRLLN